jgi:hypothetical protein
MYKFSKFYWIFLHNQVRVQFEGMYYASYLGLVAAIILRSEKCPGNNSFLKISSILKTFLSTLDGNLNFQVLLARSDWKHQLSFLDPLNLYYCKKGGHVFSWMHFSVPFYNVTGWCSLILVQVCCNVVFSIYVICIQNFTLHNLKCFYFWMITVSAVDV